MSQTNDVVDVLSSLRSPSESDGGILLSMVKISAALQRVSSAEASVERYPSTLDRRALHRTESLFPPNNRQTVQIIHMLNQG